MYRLVVTAIVVTITAATGSASTGPEADPGRSVPEATAALQTSHPALQASLNRIWRGSPSWRTAVDKAGRTGRRALVLTPDQVVVREVEAGTPEPFDRGVLAEVTPVLDLDGGVSAVLVVINLPLLEAAHEQRGSLPGEMQDDLDRVVAHEVYGHALPYLLAGTLAGRCADPVPGQRAAEACAIQRENIVRAELGLSRRTDAGLNGLMLAFRGR